MVHHSDWFWFWLDTDGETHSSNMRPGGLCTCIRARGKHIMYPSAAATRPEAPPCRPPARTPMPPLPKSRQEYIYHPANASIGHHKHAPATEDNITNKASRTKSQTHAQSPLPYVRNEELTAHTVASPSHQPQPQHTSPPQKTHPQRSMEALAHPAEQQNTAPPQISSTERGPRH